MKKLYSTITKTYSRKLTFQLILSIVAFFTSYFSQDIYVYSASALLKVGLVFLGIIFLLIGSILAVSFVFATIEYVHHIYTMFVIRKRAKQDNRPFSERKKSGEYSVNYIGPSLYSIFPLLFTGFVNVFAIMLTELMGLILIIEVIDSIVGIEGVYNLEFILIK